VDERGVFVEDEMEALRSRRALLLEEAKDDPRIATGPDGPGEPMEE